MGLPEFNELEDLLADVRTRQDETPHWEYCEGFMAALICCRRLIAPSEYLQELLAIDMPNDQGEYAFTDDTKFARFMSLWTRRWNEIAVALDTEVDDLSDERAFQPHVMDVRGAIAALRPLEKQEMDDRPIPSFGQVWALGFMGAVETWLDEWEPPRDKKVARWLDESLDKILNLTDDDTAPPTVAIFDRAGPPSISQKRLEDFLDAIWAVYDLRTIMYNLGPRVETVHKVAVPGRNDPCYCGSGKKYKKCHGAG